VHLALEKVIKQLFMGWEVNCSLTDREIDIQTKRKTEKQIDKAQNTCFMDFSI